mgnify:CR=1 FL=1
MYIWGGIDYSILWISGILGDDYVPKIKQCLNDIDNLQSWPSGVCIQTGSGIITFYHASAGTGTGRTCTLFFYNYQGNARIIGVYKHVGKSGSQYKRVWSVSSFAMPDTIKL